MATSTKVRSKVIAFHEANWSNKMIAEKVRIGRNTVSRLIQKYRADPKKDVPEPKVQDPSTRWRKVTTANIETIRRSINQKPFLEAKVIWLNNPSLQHLSIRYETFQ